MKAKQELFPLHDYRASLQGALSWLGDRHLLAAPTPRLQAAQAPHAAEPRRWHPAVVAGAARKAGR